MEREERLMSGDTDMLKQQSPPPRVNSRVAPSRHRIELTQDEVKEEE